MSLDTAKLAKLLELCSSPHDGESATAGRMAHKLIRNAGMTWEQVLTPAKAPPHSTLKPTPKTSAKSNTPIWKFAADYARKNFAEQLKVKEHEFLTSILGFTRLTEAQFKWLNDILKRCGMEPVK